MADLVIRPSGIEKTPWSLQLRYHDLGGANYTTLWRGSEETAREIIEAGEAFFLFGDPAEREAQPVK